MIDEKALKKGYITLAVIGGAMVLSIFIYAVVAEMIAKQNAPFKGFVGGFDKLDTLRYILLAVSVVLLGVTGVVRKALLSDTLSKFMTRPKTFSQTKSQPIYGQFMSAYIVVFALCESVCIYGLVLFLIAGSRFDFYLFMALSLAGYAVYFPRYGQMRAWVLQRSGETVADGVPQGRHEYDQRAGRYRR